MKISTLFKFFIPLAILLSTACTPRYHFKVDAISGGELTNSGSFYLVSGISDVKENDLRFKEAARFVATALEGKGFHRSQDLGSADILVEIFFDIGEPRDILNVHHYPETHWQPGYSFAVRVPIYSDSGLLVDYRTQIVSRPSRSYTHWEEYIQSKTVFEKELTLTAYDNRMGASIKEPKQLWNVTVTNIDHSENLRAYIPYMVTAALPYMGKDTGSQIYLSIAQDDEQAAFIKYPDAL